MYSVFALRAICSIFDNDDHYIVSKRGYEILNNYEISHFVRNDIGLSFRRSTATEKSQITN